MNIAASPIGQRRFAIENLQAKHGVATFRGAMFSGLFYLTLLTVDLSALGFCFLRSPTFAITRRIVPDVEGDFSRQAKVVHGRSQQHVAARSRSFRSKRFPLLFNECEHFVI